MIYPLPSAVDVAEENHRLRQRVTELEDLAEQLERRQSQLHHVEALLHDVFDAIPHTAFLIDAEAFHILRMNAAGAQLAGRPVEEWVGRSAYQLFPAEQAAAIEARCHACVAAGSTVEYEEHLLFPSGELWTRTLYSPIRNAEGRIHRIFGIAFDITEQKRHDLEARQQQELVIEQQSEMLAALSTPLLTISERVVVMPLIGAIDSRRAHQIMEMLLTGAATSRAAVAILDITGVTVVDTLVANALIRAAKAVKLLGTQVILTGIRPEIAQILVGLGIDLHDIVTRSSLQSGIAYAMDLKN